MRSVRTIFSLLIILLSVNGIKAGIETVNSRIGGNQIVNSAAVFVQDSRYPDVELTSTAKVARAYSKVIFGIDKNIANYYTTYSIVKLGVQIASYDKDGTLQTLPSTVELQTGSSNIFDYDDKSVYLVEGSHKITATIVYIKDENDVVIPVASIPHNLVLEVEQTTERYYAFATSTTPGGVGSTFISASNELDIYWNVIPGAEEYELEWTYVNDYNKAGTADATSNVHVNFINNSTRVRLGGNHYAVSLIFDEGYVVYRVRGIGRALTDVSKELYTKWSTGATGTISTYSASHYYKIIAGSRHEYNKNWQYSSTYAENGKKKEVVNYFDGSLRGRQTVTRLNTTQKTIVGETIYDYMGRGAIQVLPAPTQDPKIQFFSDFNKSTRSGLPPYSRVDFDEDTDTSICLSVINGMDTTLTGSAYYYSSMNTDKSGFQSYVPNAGQYPFSQIEYTPDNTGRIRKQSGVGKDHQIGTGHATRYFYGQPEQIQLDRMFGSEVGNVLHYKKNMVIDPNGQISVSYLDQAGRTIATSLAGNPPANVAALPGPDPAVEFSVNYIKTLDPLVPNMNKFEDKALVFSKQLIVPTAGDYKFYYDLEVYKYEDPCLDFPICFDCIYDLEISVKDACGADMFTAVKQQVGTIDSVCENITFSLSPNPIVAYLPVGEYSILKRLTISEKAIEYYTNSYLENNTCLIPYSNFLDSAMAKIDTSACEIDCETCVSSLGTYLSHADTSKINPNNPNYDPNYNFMTLEQYKKAIKDCNAPCQPNNLCEAAYITLLADVSPAGQYGKYEINTDGSFSATDPLSVYNTDNSLPSRPDAHWRNPKRTINGILTDGYLDEDGSRTKIFINHVGPGANDYVPAIASGATVDETADGREFIYPEELLYTTDFINAFGNHPEWAKSLVEYHPEYAYYEWCIRNSDTLFSYATVSKLTSDGFDDLLRSIDTYDDAVTAALNDPGNILDIFSKDPYFMTTASSNAQINNGQGTALASTMTSLLTHYATTSGPSLKEVCATATRCGTIYYGTLPGDCDDYGSGGSAAVKNKEWVLYRNIYLAEKQKLQQRASDAYAISQLRYNGCIGTQDKTYNPWGGGIIDFLNSISPCGYETRDLYKYKTKRFQNSNDALGQSGIDPNSDNETSLNTLVKNTDYKMYLETGQCPLTNELGFLLDDMANRSLLVSSGTKLADIPVFSQRLYDAIVAPSTPSSTPFKDYHWTSTPSGSNLTIQFREGPAGAYDGCEIHLTLPPGYAWADVKRFAKIKFTTESPTDTYNFTIVGYVGTNPTTQVLLNGYTCIQLSGCTFSDICGPSETAYQLQNLFSALAANSQLKTSGVNIKTQPYDVLYINNLIYSTPVSTATWDGTTGKISIDGVPSSCSFTFSFVNTGGGYSVDSIKYFANVRLNPSNPTTSFLVDAWVGTLSGPEYQPMVISASGACYNFQNCAPPPNKCSGPEYVNNEGFYLGLNKIVNQSKILTKFPLRTIPSILALFPFSNVNNAFWIINNHNPSGKSLTIHLKEYVPASDSVNHGVLTLTFNNVSNPHTYADIVGFSNLQVKSTGFTLLARFSDGSSELINGTLPQLKLALCETCNDYVYGTNIVQNGDCGCNGLDPSTSELDKQTAATGCGEGYMLTTNPALFCSNWTAPGAEHSGKFMYVFYNGPDKSIWKQITSLGSVTPNTMYSFRLWYKRVTGTFDLIMKINGVAMNVIHVTPTTNPAHQWFEASCLWNSGVNTSATLEVVFHRVDTGTDTYFGLDDYTFQTVTPCGNTTKDPLILPYVNPCKKNLMDIAKTNADESYNAYIKTVVTDFRNHYISTCKFAIENLKMVYTDREHHFTLYYYDQAGNLIKTVPPEGVNLVSDSGELTQIQQDRYNKAQTFFTKHTLQTRYEYNALNQLIRQATPDHSLLEKWKLNGVNLVPSTTNIYGMAFSSGKQGFVVGDNGSGTGVIYTTQDGGKTWSLVSALGVGNLQDVQFIGTTGYAISDKGELLKTVDGGSNWSTVVTSVTEKLNDLHFSSASAGVIVGNKGTILKTADGGAHWDAVTVDPAAINYVALSTINFNDVHFISSSNGFLVGSKGTILRTTDNGANWTSLPGVTNALNNTLTLNAVHFSSASLGYVAGVNPATGRGVIAIATVTGGTSTTWTYPSQFPIPVGCEYKSIVAANSTTIAVSGTNEKLYISTNSGATFTATAITGITAGSEITELQFPDSGSPLQGYATTRSGQLIKSNTSAAAWTASNVTAGTLINPPLNGLYFDPSSPTTGYVAGDGGAVLKTTNGGTSWTSLSNVTLPLLNDACMGLGSTTVGYAVGKYTTPSTSGALIRTLDGGTSWTPISTGVSEELNAVVFQNEDEGVIVGATGRLLRVSNGSTTPSVSAMSVATSVDLHDIVYLSNTPDTYVGVGASGKVIKGVPGAGWSVISTAVSGEILYSVCFVGNTGYAAGTNGTIIKSTDAGSTWTSLTSGVSAITLREIYFKDYLTGYALGDGGTLIKTVDGGVNWKPQTGTSIGDFHTAIFSPDGTAIIGGVTTSGTTNLANLKDESDDFSSRFWYDRLGRMIVSQNTKQYNKSPVAYSYTVYDALGRIKEVGEAASSVDIATLANQHGVINSDAAFSNWLSSGIRTEVTTTLYDEPVSPIAGLTQQNLRKRVSATYIDTDGDLSNGYTHSSVYSYDVHGNVKTLVQDIPELEDDGQRYKRMDYTYDLVSGNVNQLSYQAGQEDQFYHKYQYDADNRITSVMTSRDGLIWDKDAKYFYYDHGPLARMELGDEKVQSLDYVYTIQGWLKGVNSNTLDTGRDPGKDGSTGTSYTGYPEDIHSQIARDVYGYSLSYYDAVVSANGHDYSAINASFNATANDFEANATASPGYLTEAANLFNGNIKRMVTTLKDINEFSPTIGQPVPQLTAYKYDQLNRIVQMKAYRDIDVSSNIFANGSTYDQAYESAMSYDANGNLLTMRVNGESGNLAMDSFKYKYDWIDNSDPSKGKRSNRLYHVNDTTSTYDTDVDDQGTFTPATVNNLSLVNTANNYGYDEIGNLIRDNQEKIEHIEWNVYGKIKEITRMSGSGKSPISYTYDAGGNRLTKFTNSGGGNPETTYYVRDASGNIMARYRRICGFGPCSFRLDEHNIYGSSRLGTLAFYSPAGDISNLYKHVRGNKSYELSNHLGNVLTVISDRKAPVQTATTFDDGNLDGWVNNGGGRSTVAIVGGALKVTALAQWAGAGKLFSTVSGKKYAFTCTIDEGSSFPHLTAWNDGTGSRISTQVQINTEEKPLIFTGTGGNVFIEISSGSMTGDFTIDNVSLKEVGASDELYSQNFNSGSSVDGWAGDNSGTVVVNSSRLEVTLPSMDVDGVYKTFATQPGHVYNLKHTIDLNGLNVIRCAVIEGSSVITEYHYDLSSDPAALQSSFVALSTSTKIRFYFPNYGTGSSPYTFYLDDFVLEEIPGYIPDYYAADIRSTSDYYAFGAEMPGRGYDGFGYKYGFNGKEKDDEVKGQGNEYDFGARIYDPRLGRWLSIDPMASERSWVSPYNFVQNNPISRVDDDGNIDFDYTVSYKKNADGTKTKVINATAVYYVVNLSKTNHSAGSIMTTTANGGFDTKMSPKVDIGGINNARDPNDGKEIKNVEFNLTIETRDLSPNNYSSLPAGANVIFIVDDVTSKTSEVDALAWGTIGGQAIISERNASLSSKTMAHEMGHNFGLNFPSNPSDPGHSSNKSAFMYKDDSSGGLDSQIEVKNAIFDMGLTGYQKEGTYHHGKNNAQQNGRDLLQSKAKYGSYNKEGYDKIIKK